MGPIGPIRSQLYVDPLLSDVSVSIKNENYVSDIIFPEVLVKKRTGIYFEYDKSKFKVEDDLRSPGTRANRVEYALTQKAYGPLQDHSLESSIPDEDRDEADEPLELETDAVENITERLLLSKEADAQTLLSTAGTGYTNDANGRTILSGTAQWSDYVNSDPISNVRTGMDKVKSQILKTPNTLLMGYEVFSKLQDHPDIIDRIKYSQLGVVTSELMSKVFNVARVVVADAAQNTAAENQTAAMSYLWGKHAWILYITPKPGKRTVSYGYTLRKKPGRQVFRWREDGERADYIAVSDYYEHKVIAIEGCHRIVDAIA